MQQGRCVAYIYRYRENEKCENAGFIKVQCINYRTGDKVRIQIGLKVYKKNACRCKAYLIYEKEHAKYLTDIYFKAQERDTIAKRVELMWDNPLNDGRAFDIYDGILFVCDDGEMLVGIWEEYNVVPGDIRINTPVNVPAKDEAPGPESLHDNVGEPVREAAMDGLAVHEPHEEADMNESAVFEAEDNSDKEKEAAYACEDTLRENACVEMLRTYPRLPLFTDSQFLECVKIVPQDIGKLAMSNWKLGVNSFLSHGYYRYRYLMLGRVRFDNGESYVIGVPGVFTNKEKYLANMFGFNVFIPVKRTRLLTGNFGYWISEVSSE